MGGLKNGLRRRFPGQAATVIAVAERRLNISEILPAGCYKYRITHKKTGGTRPPVVIYINQN